MDLFIIVDVYCSTQYTWMPEVPLIIAWRHSAAWQRSSSITSFLLNNTCWIRITRRDVKRNAETLAFVAPKTWCATIPSVPFSPKLFNLSKHCQMRRFTRCRAFLEHGIPTTVRSVENWGKRNLVFGLLHLACCNPSPNALQYWAEEFSRMTGIKNGTKPWSTRIWHFFAQANLLLSKHSHMMWHMGNALECLQLNKNRTARRQTSPEGPISQIFAFKETGIMTQKTTTIQDKNQIDTQQLDWWPVEVRKPVIFWVNRCPKTIVVQTCTSTHIFLRSAWVWHTAIQQDLGQRPLMTVAPLKSWTCNSHQLPKLIGLLAQLAAQRK